MNRPLEMVTAFAIIALAGFLAGTALAGHWLGGNSKKAGDRDVYFWQCNLSSTVHGKFHDNDAHDIAPTRIITHSDHTCDIRDVGVTPGGEPTRD